MYKRAFTNLSGRASNSHLPISNSLRDVNDVKTSGNPLLKLFDEILRVSRFFRSDMLYSWNTIS